MLAGFAAMSALLTPTEGWVQDLRGKDPARWSTELTTPQARYQNARKEAMAAYQQALMECRTKRAAAASSCKREARKDFDDDMAHASKLQRGGDLEVERIVQ
jgi:hypothetical protein